MKEQMKEFAEMNKAIDDFYSMLAGVMKEGTPPRKKGGNNGK